MKVSTITVRVHLKIVANCGAGGPQLAVGERAVRRPKRRALGRVGVSSRANIPAREAAVRAFASTAQLNGCWVGTQRGNGAPENNRLRAAASQL